VSGRILDIDGRPIKNTLVEIWQANAAGRYIHKVDQHNAPLDPNFFGGGRCVTDENGRYTFMTIKPGAYPWGNHPNAWRPNHIHFSLFGQILRIAWSLKCIFLATRLLQYDPIYQGVPEKARHLLVSHFDLSLTQPDFALGYNFDIVLRGQNATPFENQ
jgi:protocatechuate 3,4-dioxygenase beta subunit